MAAEFDFSELDALAADLAAVAETIEPLTESQALTVVGRQVHADAVAAAPRDTGELAGSIYLRGGKGYRDVGATAKQGFFQEHGTSRHPPQPWLGPAADKGGAELARLLDQLADPFA